MGGREWDESNHKGPYNRDRGRFDYGIRKCDDGTERLE